MDALNQVAEDFAKVLPWPILAAGQVAKTVLMPVIDLGTNTSQPTQSSLPPGSCGLPSPGGVEWIRTTPQDAHTLSDRAVVAGHEGFDHSPLWVIRSNCKGDLLPGKLAIKHHYALVPWGCEEHLVKDIEVCCAHPEKIRWVESRDGNVPPNAVPGGKTSLGETLYIARAKHDGSLTPGKVHPSQQVMYMPYAGIEIQHKVYEVLCTA